MGKAADVDLRMREKETLKAGRFGIGVKETLEADLNVYPVPENAFRPEMVIVSGLLCSILKQRIPKQGLLEFLAFISYPNNVAICKVYLRYRLHQQNT